MTCCFFYTNQPFFYHDNKAEPFAFSSDTSSFQWLKYDNCQLETIDDATSDSVDCYFGCYSAQLKQAQEPPANSILMFYGNCGGVTDFDPALLNNDMPDYLIKFPFEVNNIGRACRQRIYIDNQTVQRTENVELGVWPAGHYQNMNNTLIVQWGSPPTIEEFRFNASHIFKRVSFDKMSANYYVVSERVATMSGLMDNIPDTFTIDLKIPMYYTIENLEQYIGLQGYNISFETNGVQEYANIKIDLTKGELLSLTVADNSRHSFKVVIDIVWYTFIAAILVAIIIRELGIKQQ